VGFGFQGVRGGGLFVVGLLIAPVISKYYGMPEILNPLRLAFIGILMGAFVSPRLYVLEKKMEFKRVVYASQGAAVLGSLVSILLALYMQNTYVLVIGWIVGRAMHCLLSYIICPYMPRAAIDRDSMHELLRYSRGMFGLSFLTIVALQADIFFLGKLLAKDEVGMYSLAIALAQQPGMIFTWTVGRILLPAFSEKQDDIPFLRNAVLKVCRWMILGGSTGIVIVSFCSKSLLSIVYGDEYAVVGSVFSVLCGAMLFRALGNILSNVYLAVGKPHLHRRFVILLMGLILFLLYPGIKLFGLIGAASVLLISNMLAVMMQMLWMKNLIGIQIKDYFIIPFKGVSLN
jgi:lipopolysaccharide exporter